MSATLANEINARSAVKEPMLLTPVTEQRWYEQGLGHANQVNADFFEWRHLVLASIRTGSIEFTSPVQARLTELLSERGSPT
jgi:hypothetical protein